MRRAIPKHCTMCVTKLTKKQINNFIIIIIAYDQ